VKGKEMLTRGIFHSAMFALLASTASVAYAAAPAANDVGLEEVLVTAQKRAESLQTVPLSITSLSAKELTQKGVVNFIDYGTSIPNLAFAATGDGVAASRTISIRGISGDNTTGFYIDETPVIDSIDPKIIGIDRIEVLRGPQGTLYGARSMGGTVRIITKQPDAGANFGEVHGGVSNTRLGGWNYFGDAAANLVVVPDKVAIRAVGLYQFDQGYFKRAYPNAINPALTDVVNHQANNKTYGGSLSMQIKASEKLTITPRILYQKTTYNGLPLADGVLQPDNHFAPLNDQSFTYQQVSNTPEGGEDRWALYSLDLKYDAGFGTFVSASSYFDRKSHEVESEANFITWLAQNALGAPDFVAGNSPIVEDKTFKRFVQEFRFTSSFSGPFQMTAGLYYAETKTSVIYPPAIVNGLEAATGIPGADLIFHSIVENKSKEPAVYGEFNYNLTDKLKATVGARWYQVKSTSERALQEGFAAGESLDPAPESMTERGVTPKASLQYQATADQMIYGTVSKGFRPGGIVPPVPLSPDLGCDVQLAALGVTPDQVRHFKSDSLWNYEVGGKTSWFDNRLTLNGAVFLIKWDNIQQQILLPCGFQFRANAAKAESKGFEMELKARPVQALELTAGVGYQNAKITGVSANQTSPQLPGDRVFYTPRWTLSGSFTYTVPLGNEYEIVTNGTYSYVGDSTSANNDPFNPRVRPSYSLVDGRIGLHWRGYEATLFGKNLTDEHANFADNRSIAAETPGQPRVVTNQPRTFGIEFRAHFD
jgi:iron complex outermembrane receptor protein